MARTKFIIIDRAHGKSREIGYALWLDRNKDALPAPGFVSAVPGISQDEADALVAGTVAEQTGSLTINVDASDDQIEDSIRKFHWIAADELAKKIEAERPGPLAGWSE